jgi:hypothetical protein
MTKRVQFDLSKSKSFRQHRPGPFFLQQKPLKSILKVRKGKYPNTLSRRLKALGTKTDCCFRISFVASELVKKRSKKSFRTVKPETDDRCIKKKQHHSKDPQHHCYSRIAITTSKHKSSEVIL